MADSKGDPRVHLVINLVLSAALATGVVWGLSFLGALTFSWQTVGAVTGLLMLLTYVVVR